MPGWFNHAFDNIERRSPALLRVVTSKLSTGLTLAFILIVILLAGTIEVVTLSNIVATIPPDAGDSIGGQIALLRSGLAAGFAVVIFAIVCATLSARFLTRPLRQMNAAIQAFGRNEPTCVRSQLNVLVDLERLLKVLGQSVVRNANDDAVQPVQTITKEVV